jgi:uncharacterized protein YbjT (DUF2867 family)
MKVSMRVLVLGGNGFIGRNIAAKLQLQGAQVVIGSRKVAKQSNQLQVKMQDMQQAEDWLTIINSFDVVVNSVGILRERKNETYSDIHTFAVESLADACATLQVKLIHISAIGLSATAKSGFITSKYWGEQAILASGSNALIVRPSLLDGEGGYGAKWFRRVATWPLQFVMKSDGLVAPLQVTDLGEAVANLVMNNTQTPNIVELGGSETLSIPAYLRLLRQRSGKAKALQLNAPKWAVRLASHVFDVFAWTPLSFGHFELMQGYNVPAVNMLPQLLGRKPAEVGNRSGFIRDSSGDYFADKSAPTKA